MLVSKHEIKKLSADIRRIIDGQNIDLRDNREGALSMLKNDIHTLAKLKNEQVNALSRDKSVLKDTLANISHQLKTPLTSMMIMADLLENALAADDAPPEKSAEFLSNIKIGLTRLEWLATALLKMAKLDAGAVEFTQEIVRSDELISLALEPLQILLDIKDQGVETSGKVRLLCDKRWTAEALTNVIKNASEYSPTGGRIQLSAGGNPICDWISVTDSGGGIPNSELSRIFNRYEGSRSETGYGVGLPLALAIMRGQNGDVEVDGGGNGKGATFTLKVYR